VWPAPLVRLFAPSIADDLESYRFHRPPRLSGNGMIDVGGNGSTRLEIPFQSESSVDYEFLGKFITLDQPRATVSVNGKQVRVDNLKASVFDGPITASFNYAGKGRLEGELSWTRVDLAALASCYDQNIKAGGQFMGRIQFGMNGGKVETMEGDGLFALEKTELFSVPIFGPLSPLISGVLNDRRAGFERAKSAFCTFQIRNGVLSSQDFTTSTSSLNFAGEGTVNLATRMFDMTMRMNARGLLGLLTLPLRPFSGMFQFRGTGPVNNPEWRNVVFSKPSQKLEELLSNPPKARVISEEP
jgi:hypothetical protein